MPAPSAAARFAALYAVLTAAHEVGDHRSQRGVDAARSEGTATV